MTDLFGHIYRDVPWPFRLAVGHGTDILRRKNKIISKSRKRGRHGPINSEIHSDAWFDASWTTNFNIVFKRKFILQFRWRGMFSELSSSDERWDHKWCHTCRCYIIHILSMCDAGNVCTLCVRILRTSFSCWLPAACVMLSPCLNSCL